MYRRMPVVWDMLDHSSQFGVLFLHREPSSLCTFVASSGKWLTCKHLCAYSWDRVAQMIPTRLQLVSQSGELFPVTDFRFVLFWPYSCTILPIFGGNGVLCQKNLKMVRSLRT